MYIQLIGTVLVLAIIILGYNENSNWKEGRITIDEKSYIGYHIFEEHSGGHFLTSGTDGFHFSNYEDENFIIPGSEDLCLAAFADREGFVVHHKKEIQFVNFQEVSTERWEIITTKKETYPLKQFLDYTWYIEYTDFKKPFRGRSFINPEKFTNTRSSYFLIVIKATKTKYHFQVIQPKIDRRLAFGVAHLCYCKNQLTKDQFFKLLNQAIQNLIEVIPIIKHVPCQYLKQYEKKEVERYEKFSIIQQTELPTFNILNRILPRKKNVKGDWNTFYQLFCYDFETTAGSNGKSFVYAAGLRPINLVFNMDPNFQWHKHGKLCDDWNCQCYQAKYYQNTRAQTDQMLKENTYQYHVKKHMEEQKTLSKGKEKLTLFDYLLKQEYRKVLHSEEMIYSWEKTKQQHEIKKYSTDPFFAYQEFWADNEYDDVVGKMVEEIICIVLLPINERLKLKTNEKDKWNSPHWIPNKIKIEVMAHNGRGYDSFFVARSPFWKKNSWTPGQKILGGRTMLKTLSYSKTISGYNNHKISIKIVFTDSMNFRPDSLNKSAISAGVHFKNRKKDIDHSTITKDNYLVRKEEISHYLFYDVECLAYIMYWLEGLLFSILNHKNELKISNFLPADCSPWKCAAMSCYPPEISWLNKILKPPTLVACTTSSLARMIAQTYGLQARILNQKYYREICNKVKFGGRVQICKTEYTNQNLNVEKDLIENIKIYDELEYMMVTKKQLKNIGEL